MPISKRRLIGSSIVLLAIGFVALLTIIGSTVWLSERSNLYLAQNTQLRVLQSSAVELRNALQSAEASQRGYLVGGNEIYLAPYDAAKANARAQFDRLRQNLISSSQSEAIFGRLTTAITAKIAEMDRSIGLKSDLKNEEAAAFFRTNRGKALTDEINLFLSSIIRQSDSKLAQSLTDQQQNATLLRLATIVGGLVIVLVVGASSALALRYAVEVSHARNELNALNLTLEQRVASRTLQLSEARDRAQLLVDEINHRVANSLALVASLVRLQSNVIVDQASKEALKETEARILAVASVHKRLYSSGDAREVDLQQYLSNILDHVQASMRGEGHVASLRYDLESIKIKTDHSINLGVIVTEWVTNAVKYAYPDRPGEVRIKLRKLAGERAELVVEDDGVGRTSSAAKGTGLGTRIVSAMARTIDGHVDYVAAPRGTTARLAFSPMLEA